MDTRLGSCPDKVTQCYIDPYHVICAVYITVSFTFELEVREPRTRRLARTTQHPFEGQWRYLHELRFPPFHIVHNRVGYNVVLCIQPTAPIEFLQFVGVSGIGSPSVGAP